MLIPPQKEKTTLAGRADLDSPKSKPIIDDTSRGAELADHPLSDWMPEVMPMRNLLIPRQPTPEGFQKHGYCLSLTVQ
jgi:hypothetical protein